MSNYGTSNASSKMTLPEFRNLVSSELFLLDDFRKLSAYLYSDPFLPIASARSYHRLYKKLKDLGYAIDDK